MPAPFDFPRRPVDSLLTFAGQSERVGRAVWQRLRQLKPPVGTEDIAALAGARWSPMRESGTSADGPPVIYLPALPWSYRFQRPQQLACALGESGHPTLYVDGFLRSRIQPRRSLTWRAPGVAVLQVALPRRPDPFRSLLTMDGVRRLADLLVAGLARRPMAIVAQLPFWGSLGIELRRRLDIPLIYDRIDLHTDFPGVPPRVGLAEDELVQRSDLVTATSLDLLRRSGELTQEVRLLPNAVAYADHQDHVPGGRADLAPPDETPVAGFVGALNFRIDAAALKLAAEALPGWRFRLAGRVEEAAVGDLGRLPNVELLGEIPYRQVASFLAALDVGIIPYRDIPLTRSIDPVKLYEMFGAGLPVVARGLPEMKRFDGDLVALYDEPGQLPALLASAVRDDNPALVERRRATASEHTWRQRAEDLIQWCADLA